MTLKKTHIMLAALMLAAATAKAQTVAWTMQPIPCDVINYLGNGFFEMKNGNSMRLTRPDGLIGGIPPLYALSAKPYFNHVAILTSTDDKGERIWGVITDKGELTIFSTWYYALAGQKFFSDGLLSVADDYGMLGYITPDGKAALGFDDKYIRIKPFSEGYAAVQNTKKRYVLIDKNGVEQKFEYGGTGVGVNIGGCTNVYEGISYVYDEYGEKDGSLYIYNVRTRDKLKKTKRMKNFAKDYLYCYQEVTGRNKEVPYAARPAGQKTTFKVNGRDVEFEDGYAVMEVDNEKGILRLFEGSFSATAIDTAQVFYKGDEVQCRFRLDIPKIWQERRLEISLQNEQGDVVPYKKLDNGTVAVAYKPTGTGALELRLFVEGENIKLYNTTLRYAFSEHFRCSTCHKDVEECAYGGKHPVQTDSGEKKNTDSESVCPTCGKKISECRFQGVH